MNKHWYVIGHRAGARIFEQLGIHPEFKLKHRFENPEGSFKTSELVSDRQGRSDSSTMPGHNPVGNDDSQKKQVLEKFAHELCAFLEREAELHTYKTIVLVAEPHVLGVLKKGIGKATSRLLLKTVSKDLVHISDHDMAAHLAESLCTREAIEFPSA